MTVLKGEGTHVILYGTYTLPSTRMVPAYMARPNQSGTFPSIVVAHDSDGVTPHTKAVCRRLARHGFAVVCPDLFRGNRPTGGFGGISDGRGAADLAAGVEFVGRPGTEWASGDRVGLLGLGVGGRFVVLAAVRPELCPGAVIDAIAVVGTPLGPSGDRPPLDLARLRVPLLGLFGGQGPAADDARAGRTTLARGEFVLYGGMGAGFTDDSSGGYDAAAAADALDRLVAFFGEHLG